MEDTLEQEVEETVTCIECKKEVLKKGAYKTQDKGYVCKSFCLPTYLEAEDL